MINFKEKINENKDKSRLIVIIALSVMIVIRIFFSEKIGILKYLDPEDRSMIRIFQCATILLEILAVFLKSVPATILSVINIVVSIYVFGYELINLAFETLFFIFATGFKFACGLTLEVFLNILFCIAGGIVIILKEVKNNENR